MFSGVQLFATKDYTLKLKNGDVTLNASNPSMKLSELKESLSSQYIILQFTQVPTNDEKVQLSKNGITLLEYIPLNAFIAEIDNASNTSLKELNIRGAIPFLEAYKYSAALTNEENPEYAINGNKIDLIVEAHLNVAKKDFNNLIQNKGADILYEDPSGEYIEIRINRNRISDLANESIVKSIDYIPAPPEKEDQRGRTLHRGNMLDSEHPLGRKYDGTGVSVAIADDGPIGPHIDIKGRVTQISSAANGSHGDMTTGITMGAGNLNPDYRGMATGAYLYYYDIGGYPHIAGAVNNLNIRDVVITSTSYSEGCNAGYTATTRVVDQQTRQNPTLLHVFSAGNSASSTCGGNAYGAGTPWGTITGGRKQGKATIATGNLEYNSALTASSSRGPAADGRIKPDICSNGTNQMSTAQDNNYQVGGGTSAAAPGIAGLAAQMYHGYRTLNGGADPDAGLIKSAMLNTARDLGNRGPDFFYGWGRVNAHRAMKLIEENRYLDSTISQNGNNSHNVTIGSNVDALQFMIYWTDYEASTAASQALVNNLDLKVVTPSGDTILPWILDPTPNAINLNTPATRGIDNLNNMEQVLIDTVSAGTYTLLVNGKTVPQGPQKYFVLWETRSNDIEVTYPSGGESFTPRTIETIRWDAINSSGSVTVEYSLDNGTNWILIGSNSASFKYRDWFVPDTVSGNVLIRVTNGSTSGVSAHPFSIISTPSNITTSFVCPDSIGLTWTAVPGATEYEIYVMGNLYMDSVGRSSSTNYTLKNLVLSNDNWVSVKALSPANGIEGKRSIAILMPKVIDFCYQYDAEIVDITVPSSSGILNCAGTSTPVSALIFNNGSDTLRNFPILLRYGNSIVFDTVPGPIASNTNYTFNFKDSINLSGFSNVTLTVRNNLSTDSNSDNDSISKTFVVLNSLQTLPYTEDFETFNLCPTTSDCGGTVCNLNNGWLNLSEDDFDMRTNFGATPSTGTGPSMDHNPGTSSGKYLYSEASNGCTNSNSILVSPCFDLTNTINPEFKFWYHMNGASIGSMRVDVFANGVWNLNAIPPFGANQGNLWREKTVNMSSYAGQIVNIRFQVRTGIGWESDIAIDDISFIDQATGLNDNLITNAFRIYPNPSSGVFTVQFDEIPKNNVQILDINGRLVKVLSINSTINQIDLSSYTKGIYFLNVENTGIKEKLVVY